MTVLLSGGGLRTGQVVGATNAKAEYPTQRPYTPQDVLATVYRHLGIVLAHPGQFADWFEDRAQALAALAAECQPFDTPERIDHGQHSHPKARIPRHFPDYDENVHGPSLAFAIGLPTLRQRCPQFGAWLTRLGQLDQ
jgi:hypothetical protein